MSAIVQRFYGMMKQSAIGIRYGVAMCTDLNRTLWARTTGSLSIAASALELVSELI